VNNPRSERQPGESTMAGVFGVSTSGKCGDCEYAATGVSSPGVQGKTRRQNSVQALLAFQAGSDVK
jgi:hypothetical protein